MDFLADAAYSFGPIYKFYVLQINNKYYDVHKSCVKRWLINVVFFNNKCIH